jgi:hypothetical protein
MAKLSVSKTELGGSNPSAPARFLDAGGTRPTISANEAEKDGASGKQEM